MHISGYFQLYSAVIKLLTCTFNRAYLENERDE
jgi:hypothetical protein